MWNMTTSTIGRLDHAPHVGEEHGVAAPVGLFRPREHVRRCEPNRAGARSFVGPETTIERIQIGGHRRVPKLATGFHFHAAHADAADQARSLRQGGGPPVALRIAIFAIVSARPSRPASVRAKARPDS